MDLTTKKKQLKDEGYCIIPDVLDAASVAALRDKLWAAVDLSEARGLRTRNIGIDPNEHNVRVFNLIDLDPAFVNIAQHDLAIDIVAHLLGPDFLLSNLTANIALPGAKSMKIHSDQGIVVPEPWFNPWSINIIWCLDDIYEANGATRFIPGSQHYKWASELPADAAERTVAFEAKAGSVIAMDGRTWHTSGANVTADKQRALLFGYYSSAFIRPQQNWNAALSEATLNSLDPQMREMLGLGAVANTKLGHVLVT